MGYAPYEARAFVDIEDEKLIISTKKRKAKPCPVVIDNERIQVGCNSISVRAFNFIKAKIEQYESLIK